MTIAATHIEYWLNCMNRTVWADFIICKMTVLTKDFTPNWICVQCEQRASPKCTIHFFHFSYSKICQRKEMCTFILFIYSFHCLVVFWQATQADKFSAKGHYTIQSDRRFTSL